LPIVSNRRLIHYDTLCMMRYLPQDAFLEHEPSEALEAAIKHKGGPAKNRVNPVQLGPGSRDCWEKTRSYRDLSATSGRVFIAYARV
jgi:hypothetical protein